MWINSNRSDSNVWHLGREKEIVGPKTGKILSTYRVAVCTGRKLGGAWGQTERASVPEGGTKCARCEHVEVMREAHRAATIAPRETEPEIPPSAAEALARLDAPATREADKFKTCPAGNPAPLKGLLVTLYSHPRYRRCAAGGVSERFDEFVLVIPEELRAPGQGTTEVFDARPDMPALMLVRRVICGRPYYCAEPVDGRPDPSTHAGPMFGGSYVVTSDSRLSRICPYPIPVHDRFDTWADYEALSR